MTIDPPGARRRAHPIFNAHRIAPRLWQGAIPAVTRGGTDALAKSGFSMALFCALERQPIAAAYPGTAIVRVPLDDDFDRPVNDETWGRIVRAAWIAASHRRAGGRVMITCCYMGLNRSGIATAATLSLLHPRLSPERIVRIVQHSRPGALSNPRFVEALLARLPLVLDCRPDRKVSA